METVRFLSRFGIGPEVLTTLDAVVKDDVSPVPRDAVDSTALASVGGDVQTSPLEIVFHDGGIYRRLRLNRLVARQALSRHTALTN